MAGSTTLALRRAWFQVHKWIGLLLMILLIPVAVSGSALVWHDWLDATLNPQRYAVTAHEAKLSPARYAALAQAALAPGERVASVRMPEHGGPVVVSAMKPPAPGVAPRPGPPQRTNLYLDPGTGRLLDQASSNAGLVRWLHVFHGSLQGPGVGRSIVGWLGVAMLISCLTGLWLWWPTVGRWTRGLRWRRQNKLDGDLHHQLGFWVAIPLALLSLTGAWISFPQFFARFSGAPQQEARSPGGAGKAKAGPPDRFAAMRSPVLAAPALDADRALAIASAEGKGALVSVGWPTELVPNWKVAFAQGEGRPKEIAVADATGAIEQAPSGPPPNATARLMRQLHDGAGMGALYQTIIFVAGLIPLALGITGITMWLRTRRWRGAVERRKPGQMAAAE